VLHTVRNDDALKATAIILISGIDDLDTVATYLEAGADDFLPKPFNRTLLKVKIRNALERSRYRLKTPPVDATCEAFCSQLAHDLNNGLTGIMMSAELLLMEDLSASSKHYLEDIIASTEGVSTLIKERRKHFNA